MRDVASLCHKALLTPPTECEWCIFEERFCRAGWTGGYAAPCRTRTGCGAGWLNRYPFSLNGTASGCVFPAASVARVISVRSPAAACHSNSNRAHE